MLQRYRQLRALTRTLPDRLLEALPTDAFKSGAARLGMFSGGELRLNSEDELPNLIDFVLYSHLTDGLTPVQHHLATSTLATDTLEHTLLVAMSRAHVRLLSIEEVIPGLGCRTADILRREPIILIDEALSQTASTGDFLASRVIDLPDFSMTTGAARVFGSEVLLRISAALPNLPFDVRAKTVYAPEEEAALAALFIEQTAPLPSTVEDAPVLLKHTPSTTRRPRGRIARNAPCPCGSKRRYKGCCGKSANKRRP